MLRARRFLLQLRGREIGPSRRQKQNNGRGRIGSQGSQHERGSMTSSTALAHGAPDRSNAASGDASSDDSEDDDIDALLMQACSAGSEDVASTLLRHGASASTRDEHALCPLHHAAWNGHTGIARLLLSHGADWRARDRRGATAAHLAAQFRHADVLALLLEAAGEVGGAKALLQSRCGLGRSVQDTVADFATAGAARPLPEGIPPGFTDQASALAWPIRRLLVDGDAPEAVSAAAVLKAMRLPWRQYQRAAAALEGPAERLMLRAAGVLDARACAALRDKVDSSAQQRRGARPTLPLHPSTHPTPSHGLLVGRTASMASPTTKSTSPRRSSRRSSAGPPSRRSAGCPARWRHRWRQREGRPREGLPRPRRGA